MSGGTPVGLGEMWLLIGQMQDQIDELTSICENQQKQIDQLLAAKVL